MCTLVLENIRFHAGIAAKQSKVYLDMLTEMKESKRQEEVNCIKKELKSVDKRLANSTKFYLNYTRIMRLIKLLYMKRRFYRTAVSRSVLIFTINLSG